MMAAPMLETPSRIWRRIEAGEEKDMPSLPSVPVIEDSALQDSVDSSASESLNLSAISAPITSTPAPSSHVTSTTRGTSTATLSSQRFANSIARSASRSSFSKLDGSFEVPSLPEIRPETNAPYFSELSENELGESIDSVPEVYLPPEDNNEQDDDNSLAEALEPISRPLSPSELPTPKKGYDYYDYSISLKSEPKPSPKSPFDKYRNVAMRRPKPVATTRTPSLTRSITSNSSPANSTPDSNHSVALPRSSTTSPSLLMEKLPSSRSATASPAIYATPSNVQRHNALDVSHGSMPNTESNSMDITDVHISPPQPPPGEEYGLSVTTTSQSTSHEPTFSTESEEHSDDVDPQHSLGQLTRELNLSPAGQKPSLSSVLSSPAGATPTPAFPPRPRARFTIPNASDETEHLGTPRPASQPELYTPQQRQAFDDDMSEYETVLHDHSEMILEGHQTPKHGQSDGPLTPHTRRRSFLLSVINSTARPRPRFNKLPTPHPLRHAASPGGMSTTENTPISSRGGSNLQVAFAGATPRPAKHLSAFGGLASEQRPGHSLPQGVSASLSKTHSASSDFDDGPVTTQSRFQQPMFSTPGPLLGAGVGSGYDSDRASFISTASSHDLTTHQRANTSFDPSMGFGLTGAGGGGGVGRFNAGKLNSYLHGLNRRLQEENEVLARRVMELEEDRITGSTNHDERSLATPFQKQSGRGRRVSAGGTPDLDDVEEGWLEEKAQMEELADALKQDLDEAQKALEDEKENRSREKERWKENMGEVEKGVRDIILDLEKKLKISEQHASDAERRESEMQKKVAKLEAELEDALTRADKVGDALQNGHELGGELRAANERISAVLGDLRNANVQIKELEDEVRHSDERIDDLESDLNSEKERSDKLEAELEAERDRAADVEAQVLSTVKELKLTKEYVSELEGDAVGAADRIRAFEDQIARADQDFESLAARGKVSAEKIEDLEASERRAAELATQTEEALRAAETRMRADEIEIASLQGQINALEKEKERLMDRSQSVQFRHNDSQNPFVSTFADADVQALENELDDAHREIGRVTALLNQSPARKALDKAKDAKINVLEREVEDLLERNKALRRNFNDIASPGKVTNTSGISPFHRQVLSMSIRPPRTPGAPIPDMSWLNNTTNADPSISPLVAEISRLQRELDIANESIDDKIDRLEEAGLGVVGLTRKLEDARSHISSLEDEIARLSRTEERRLHQLKRLRCQKCRVKIDIAQLEEGNETSRSQLLVDSSEIAGRSSDALRCDLQNVNAQLSAMKRQWDEEKQRLLGENNALQDVTNRLKSQMTVENRKTKENEKVEETARLSMQEELETAKATIAELESNLKTERSRLRSFTTEQTRIQKDKDHVLTLLQRTESDMEDVRQQLVKIKQENRQLENELRENATVEQRARLLDARAAENADTIDRLRHERSLLAADHKELQKQFSELSDHAKRLHEKHAYSQVSHDNRRHQLDLQLLELEDLRSALSNRGAELQHVESENIRITAEKSDVVRTIAALETDLNRVRKDAEAFGRDLKLLRAEKERIESTQREELSRADRLKKQSQAEIRLLNEQLDNQRDKASRLQADIDCHVCDVDSSALSMLKAQHNKECKGLIVQIKYLKAKFTRESCLRQNLAYQKQYLLILLSRLEKTETTVFAAIARIGFAIEPTQEPARTLPRLRSVAIMAVFLSRIRRASEEWREHTTSKQAVVAALQEVRRKRAQVPSQTG